MSDNALQAYTREELAALDEGARPTRGLRCPKCRSHIPQFKELTEEQARKLRTMDSAQAMKVLRDLTGCPIRFAKIWVIHRDGPHPGGFGERVAPPCPVCGKQLRTKHAKQCVECGADWHQTAE